MIRGAGPIRPISLDITAKCNLRCTGCYYFAEGMDKVQIPADEQPIILMVEQTVGGYAKIVTVISVDLPRVAQATPGDTIHFERVSLETAHALYQDQQKKMGELKNLLASR